jgi:hypothetical protein
MNKTILIVLVVIIAVVAVLLVVAVPVLMSSTSSRAVQPASGAQEIGGVGGAGIICQLTSRRLQGETQTELNEVMKLELPDKMRYESTIVSAGITGVIILNGDIEYMFDPLSGGGWTKMNVSGSPYASFYDLSLFEGKTPKEIEDLLRLNLASTGAFLESLSCSSSIDIPDSEFLPPVGVRVTDLEEEAGPLYGVASTFTGFGAVKPVEWSCSGGTISVSITNGAGGMITGVSVDGGSCQDSEVAAGATTVCTISNADGCMGVQSGKSFSSKIDILYTSPTGQSRTSSGTIRGPAD